MKPHLVWISAEETENNTITEYYPPKKRLIFYENEVSQFVNKGESEK